MNKTRLMFVLLASLILGACSSDDDNNVNDPKNAAYTETSLSEAPVWQVDWSYDQKRPDWQEPAAESFENWTVMLVKIEKALLPYVSADDMLALFVGNELRGLSKPAVLVSTGEVDATQFLLKAYGNESKGDEVVLTMKYYNAQLKQVFSLTEAITLDEEVLLGFDEDFIPAFTQGSAKYPVTATIDVAATLAKSGLTFARGNIVAAFVGDECRGVGDWSLNGKLIVFLREKGEAVTLKYYDATASKLYTIPNAVKL